MAPSRKKGFAARERVAVKQKLFSAAIARLPAKQRMLPVLAIAHIIGIRPIGVGHGGIVFLDPALHFGKQRFLQSCYCRRARARNNRSLLAGKRGSQDRAEADRASPPASSGSLSQANSSVSFVSWRLRTSGRCSACGSIGGALSLIIKAYTIAKVGPFDAGTEAKSSE